MQKLKIFSFVLLLATNSVWAKGGSVSLKHYPKLILNGVGDVSMQFRPSAMEISDEQSILQTVKDPHVIKSIEIYKETNNAPREFDSRYEFDSHGNIIKIKQCYSFSSGCNETTLEYDKADNLIREGSNSYKYEDNKDGTTLRTKINKDGAISERVLFKIKTGYVNYTDQGKLRAGNYSEFFSNQENRIVKAVFGSAPGMICFRNCSQYEISFSYHTADESEIEYELRDNATNLNETVTIKRSGSNGKPFDSLKIVGVTYDAQSPNENLTYTESFGPDDNSGNWTEFFTRSEGMNNSRQFIATINFYRKIEYR